MFWEVDEAARCWGAGKLECETIPWEESILVMKTTDEIRRQAGLTYPEEIETTVYTRLSWGPNLQDLDI